MKGWERERNKNVIRRSMYLFKKYATASGNLPCTILSKLRYVKKKTILGTIPGVDFSLLSKGSEIIIHKRNPMTSLIGKNDCDSYFPPNGKKTHLSVDWKVRFGSRTKFRDNTEWLVVAHSLYSRHNISLPTSSHILLRTEWQIVYSTNSFREHHYDWLSWIWMG